MKKIMLITLFLCLLASVANAYDFEKNGLLYRITDYQKRTVEVTHWDELTGANGVPGHYRPDLCSAHHHHDSAHVHDEHCGHHQEKEHIPVIPEFPDTVIIPAKVWYKGRIYKVTAVGDGSFYGRKNIRLVRLPKTIRRIGQSAFRDCTLLERVEWPATIDTIGSYAFYMDYSLEKAVLPDSMKYIGWYAFALCDRLREVRMPAGLACFEGNAFLRCRMLKRILLNQQTPPVVKSTGIKMNFEEITFEVQEEALLAYQNDKFWSKQQVQTIQK